jgi:hypothetical protein
LKSKTKNKFETQLEKQLKKAKVKFKYESEKIPYILARHYIPDFVITTRSGGKIYIEAKGYLRPEHKSKMVAVKIAHPNLDIRIVFYAKNPKYIRWAERNSFPYAIGSIPEEWLNE